MSLKQQSALIFATSVLQLFFGMVAGVLTARLLGPEGKGIALLAFFVPQFATSLGTLSLGEASIYFLGRGTQPGKVVGTTIVQALGLGTLYAGILLLFLSPLKAKVVPDVPVRFIVLGLTTLPLQLFKNQGDCLLVGMRRVRHYAAGNLSLHMSRGLFLFLALWVLKLGIPGAIGAEIAAWTLTSVYYFVFITRGLRVDWRYDWSFTMDQLRYGLQTHIGNLAQRLNLRVSVLILSSLAGAAAVGLYSVAVNLAEMLWYIPNSVGLILFPRVASSSRVEANRLTPMVCRNTILLTAVACVLMVFLAPLGIRILYGEKFLGSVRPLYLLLPGVLALSVSKVLTKHLSGIGKPIFNSVASVVSFVANAPLLYVLVKGHGIEGAAIATTTAYMVHAVVVFIFFVRESGAPAGSTLLPSMADLPLYRESVEQVWRRIFRR